MGNINSEEDQLITRLNVKPEETAFFCLLQAHSRLWTNHLRSSIAKNMSFVTNDLNIFLYV